MKNASELLEEAVYAGNLSENEEKRLYSWIESLILAKRKYDEDEAKVEAFDEVMDLYVNGSNKYLQTKRHTLDVFIEDVAEILKPFTDKYESGESE